MRRMPVFDKKYLTLPFKTSLDIEKIFWPLVLLALSPWFYLQIQQVMNADIVWLAHGSQRLLEGYSMSENIYETNPPLSLMLYVPPVLLSKYSAIPLFYTVFLYTIAMFALSAFAVHKILISWDFLSKNDARVLTAIYLVSASILASRDFGERDHILMFGLLPFVLTQISMTYKRKLNDKLSWLVLAAGTVMILLKPHHGLLPVILLIHRMFVQKRFFSIVLDKDFICLAIGTLSYIAITFLFFRDFIDVILPDVLRMYLSNIKEDIVPIKTLCYAFTIFAISLGTLCFDLPTKKRNLALSFLFFALISLIPYVIQMKGFHYHVMPAFIFFVCGLFFAVYILLSKYITESKAVLLTVVIATIFAHAIVPLNFDFPKHKDFKGFELTRLVQDCGEDCSFFMFNDNMALFHTTSLYTGKEHASRFPVYWFLPYIYNKWDRYKQGKSIVIPKERLFAYVDKYTAIVAEDFTRGKPELVLLGQFKVLHSDKSDFDFVEFFSNNEDFRNEWKNYYKDGEIEINRRIYFPGTVLDKDHIIPYDIYRRK